MAKPEHRAEVRWRDSWFDSRPSDLELSRAVYHTSSVGWLLDDGQTSGVVRLAQSWSEDEGPTDVLHIPAGAVEEVYKLRRKDGDRA